MKSPKLFARHRSQNFPVHHLHPCQRIKPLYQPILAFKAGFASKSTLSDSSSNRMGWPEARIIARSVARRLRSRPELIENFRTPGFSNQAATDARDLVGQVATDSRPPVRYHRLTLPAVQGSSTGPRNRLSPYTAAHETKTLNTSAAAVLKMKSRLSDLSAMTYPGDRAI